MTNTITKLHFNGVDYDVGAANIHGITEKNHIEKDDELLIADSWDSYNNKRVTVGNLVQITQYIGRETQQCPTYSDNKDYICGIYSSTLQLAKYGLWFYRNWHLQHVDLSAIYNSTYGSAYTAMIYNWYIYIVVYHAGNNTDPFKLFKCSIENDITITSNWVFIADFARGWSQHTLCVLWFDGDYLILGERKMDWIVYITQCDLNWNVINQINTGLNQSVSVGLSFAWHKKYYIWDSSYKIHIYLQDGTDTWEMIYNSHSAFAWCWRCYGWYNASYPVCPQFPLL